MVSSKKRFYVCTINFPQEDDPVDHIPKWSDCKWLKQVSFQLERGAKKGKLHWQVCVEFKDGRLFCDLLKYFPTLRCKVKDQKDNVLAARNYVHKADTRAGPSYSWRKGHYVSLCYHQKMKGCCGTSAGNPASWLPAKVPYPSFSNGGMTEKEMLKVELQNKIDEMRYWQAYLDTGFFPERCKQRLPSKNINHKKWENDFPENL